MQRSTLWDPRISLWSISFFLSNSVRFVVHFRWASFFLSPLIYVDIDGYEGYNQLYAKYKDQGFEILAFPCNQFMYEMGDSEACALKYDADFPHFGQLDVLIFQI